MDSPLLVIQPNRLSKTIMLNTPFSPWPSYSAEEIQAVSNILASNRVNYWTGELCRTFEKEFAEWCGAKYAVALANGTLALDVALKALNIGPGDEVVVTPRTYIASVSCVVNAGAIPIFADIDRDSGNLSAKTIEQVLTPRTKAVICVHLAGWPCDMDPIMKLAQEKNFYVIEDCAQAHGALYKNRHVGTIGHIGAWSFCQDKIMTTGGEGGMVTTNDYDLWSKMWSFKDHGKSWEAIHKKDHPPGYRWVHESFGTNWRMLEIQAALGLVQLKKMKEWTAKRSSNAQALLEICQAFSGAQGPLRTPTPPTDVQHAWYKFYAYIQQQNLPNGWSRDRIIQEINDAGVPCYHGSCSEVYLEKAFDHTNWRPSKALPIAHELGETSLMLLVHPTLTQAEINKTRDVLEKVFGRA